ncbi:MAG TPA: DNA N-6-adenine-methyltransferase [Tepidisphaeraceae bacterium]|nr:DNA N-6-adenine-methyltransferase [Tepidisphaeraceae bacterium]
MTSLAPMPSAEPFSDVDWLTPGWLLDLVRAVDAAGMIGLDPCTTRDNPVRAMAFLTERENGLIHSWGGYGLVYVNPPYSREASPPWARKIAAEAATGLEIIALLPVRADTAWWHLCVPVADAVCFLRGRPKFLRPDGTEAQTGKVPIAAVYYGDRAKAFARVFGPYGWIPGSRAGAGEGK